MERLGEPNASADDTCGIIDLESVMKINGRRHDKSVLFGLLTSPYSFLLQKWCFVKYLCSSFQILSQLFALLLKSIPTRNHVNGNDRRSSVKKK